MSGEGFSDSQADQFSSFGNSVSKVGETSVLGRSRLQMESSVIREVFGNQGITGLIEKR